MKNIKNIFFLVTFLPAILFGQHTMVNGSFSACSGTILDPGGAGNYANSLTVTETYCSNASNALQITFSTFSTENGYDYLEVFDGPTTGSTLIGNFTGTTTPAALTSSTGCLTLRFTSDGSVTSSGWAATLSCVAFPTCSDGIQNGSETGIDCGGPCTACVAPAGYSCASAVAITDGYTTASTITSPGTGGIEDWVTTATVTSGNAATDDFTDPDVYLFSYTTGSVAGESFYFTIEYDVATDENHSIAVWSGCTGTSLTGNITSSTQIISDINGVCASNLAANTTYYISVGNAHFSTRYLRFDVVEFIVEIDNVRPDDECATASLMNSSLPISGSTRCFYSASAGSPAGCGSIQNDSWVRFTASASSAEISYEISNCTSNWGVQLSVFEGSCGALTLIPGSCINYAANNSTGLWSFAGLTPGNDYYIRADGYAGDLCTYTYQILSGIVLPVGLISFDGERNGIVNHISWSTSSETNNHYFLLEKSIDGFNFNYLTTLQGAGNSSKNLNYNFQDVERSMQTTYYRLTQVDFDGHQKQEGIITVRSTSLENDIVEIFPNPAKETLSIRVNSSNEEIATILIYNTLGQNIYSETINTGVTSLMQLNVSDYDKGTYFIEIQSSSTPTGNVQKIIFE
jgi:hypothetical protein